MKIIVAVLIAIAVLVTTVLLLGVVTRPSPAPTPTPVPTITRPTPTLTPPTPGPTTKPIVTLAAEELMIKARAGEVKVGDTIRVIGMIDHSNLKNDVIKVGEGTIVLWRGMFALAPAGKRVTVEGKITSIGKNSIDLEEARLMGDP